MLNQTHVSSNKIILSDKPTVWQSHVAVSFRIPFCYIKIIVQPYVYQIETVTLRFGRVTESHKKLSQFLHVVILVEISPNLLQHVKNS